MELRLCRAGDDVQQMTDYLGAIWLVVDHSMFTFPVSNA